MYFFAEGEDNSHQYKGMLPKNIDFSDNKETVNKKLGKPFKSGGGTTVSGILVKQWDKWKFLDYYIIIEYYDNNKIKMITLRDWDI